MLSIIYIERNIMKLSVFFIIIYTIIVICATAILLYAMMMMNRTQQAQTPTVIIEEPKPEPEPEGEHLQPTRTTLAYPSHNPEYANRVSFEQIGTLSSVISEREKIILPLFARRLHHDRYEYYTVTENDMKLRIDIKHNNRVCSDTQVGCDEIYDGDVVSVPSYNGDFVVSKYSYRRTF